MAKIYGGAVKWGIGTTGLTGSGIAVFIPQRVEVKTGGKQVEIQGADGNTKTVVFHDENVLEATFVIKPSGATLSAAKTNNVIPTPGTKITAVDTTDTQIAGDWLVISASKSIGTTDPSEITVECRRYDSSVMTEVPAN